MVSADGERVGDHSNQPEYSEIGRNGNSKIVKNSQVYSEFEEFRSEFNAKGHLSSQFSAASNPNISRRYVLKEDRTGFTDKHTLIVYQKLERMVNH
jgi:hypothetical protein